MALSRRSLLVGAGTLLGSLTLPRRVLAGGAKILLLGGSTMGGALGKYLEDALRDAGYSVTRRAKASSGLARPDFFDWEAEAGKLRASASPAATVVMFGGNDGQGLFMGKDADPEWIKWDEAGWTAEYSKRVRALARAVAPDGEHVFWIGMPAVRSPRLNKRIKKMNGIYAAEMGKQAHGHFLDLVPVLSNGTGAYTDFVRFEGKQVKARGEDGVHLSMQGAKVVVSHVAPKVREKIAVS